MLDRSYEIPLLEAGGEDSDGEVALLSRDCGRDDSKEPDEELA